MPTKLRLLDLAHISITGADLLLLFSSSSTKLRRVILEDVTLTQGDWVKVFEAMNVLLSPMSINFCGHLKEKTGTRVFAKLSELQMKGFEEGGWLLERVLDYIEGRVLELPLLPALSRDAKKQWKEMSDKSMKWK